MRSNKVDNKTSYYESESSYNFNNKENWKVNSKNTMCFSKKNENVKNVEQK